MDGDAHTDPVVFSESLTARVRKREKELSPVLRLHMLFEEDGTGSIMSFLADNMTQTLPSTLPLQVIYLLHVRLDLPSPYTAGFTTWKFRARGKSWTHTRGAGLVFDLMSRNRLRWPLVMRQSP